MKTIAAVALGLVFAGGCKDGGNAAVQPVPTPRAPSDASKSAGKQPTATDKIPREKLENLILHYTTRVNDTCDFMVKELGGEASGNSVILEAARQKLFESNDDGDLGQVMTKFRSEDILPSDLVGYTLQVLVDAADLLRTKSLLAESEGGSGAQNGVN